MITHASGISSLSLISVGFDLSGRNVDRQAYRLCIIRVHLKNGNIYDLHTV